MAWISEIHYQNTYASSSGVAEYVEVSLSPEEFVQASDFEFAAYQGTGASSLVVNLGTLTPTIDPDNGYYVYTITVTTTDPDTGVLGAIDAEAIALIDISLASPVVEFYDIGGGTTSIVATDGPAIGATSTNIPASSSGTSIQFTKYGDRIDDVLSQDSSVICFCRKTLIETSEGAVPVEDLAVGSLVLNDKGDFLPLRWIGRRKVMPVELAQSSKLHPIRISAGALGRGLPTRDLLVSRQHRLLVSSKIVERMFGKKDVLVSAVKLSLLPGIYTDENVDEVEYFYLLFDSHEIIFAEGVPTESLYTGPEALRAVSPEMHEEILMIFPHLAKPNCNFEPAAHIPEAALQKQLVNRHAKNQKPLLC